MDKKTITAFVLIFAVLILSNYLFKPEPKPSVPQQTESTIEAVTEAKEDKIPVSKPASQEQPIEEFVIKDTTEFIGTEEIYVFENELMTVYLSSKGANIGNIELKKYFKYGMNDHKTEVELFAEKDYSNFNLVGEVSGSDLSFRDNIFVIDSSAISSNIYSFKAKFNDATITKEYIFSENEYEFEVKLSIDNNVFDKYSFQFPIGQQVSEKDRKSDLEAFNYIARIGTETENDDMASLKDEPSSISGNIGWFGTRSRYFTFILKNLEPSLKAFFYSENEGIQFYTSVPVSKDFTHSYKVYAGPLDYDQLSVYDLTDAIETGWSFLRWLNLGLMFLLKYLMKAIPNVGLVLIILAFIVKIVLNPLTKKQTKSMRRMQEMAPKVNEIKERYKNDPKRANVEVMNLYKEEGVNPVGGCLPLLLQMPIFISLFQLLRNTIALRQAEFIFFWKDLSQPDPYYLLPIFMGIMVYFQSSFQPQSPDPQQQKTQKIMKLFMPGFLIFVFLNMPSGLCLYYASFNLFSLLQTLYQQKYKMEITK